MSEKINIENLNIQVNKEIKEKIVKNLSDLVDSLKSRGGIPIEANLNAKFDLKSGNVEYYFIEDKDGKIIKFADLRKNDKFLNTLREYFQDIYIDERGYPLTDKEFRENIDNLADLYLEIETSDDNQIEN